MTSVQKYQFGALKFQILKITSGCAAHPTTTLTAPKGTVILGGGAYVDWQSAPCAPISPAGNLLTAMYPNDSGTTWTVASKDHEVVSPATVTAYCIVAEMSDGTPIPRDQYKVVSTTSTQVAHPSMQINLPDGFTIVGGGARANWTGAGSLLFASYPTPDLRGWVASSKDHDISDPSTITVWAIGLKDTFLRRARMVAVLKEQTSSPPVNHPHITEVLSDFYLTGVGARVNWGVEGNLLTAVFPQDRETVVAEGKDHIHPDPANITAYAIGFGRA